MTRLFCALSFLLILSACSSPKPLVYQDLRNFRVHNVSVQQITLVAELKFYNPNGYGLSLKNGNVDAFFNDKYLGKATIDERTAIPARDTFLLPVSVTADLRSLLSNALGILSKQNTDVMVRLQGSVKAGKGGIFVNVPVNYSGKQRLTL